MTQQILPQTLADLAHSNAKARLGAGEVETFPAFHKETGEKLTVDVRTFDESIHSLTAPVAEESKDSAAEE